MGCIEIDTTLNPIGIAAFALTCVGCVQTLVAIFLNNWWTMSYSSRSRTYYGVWSKLECNSQGYCQSDSATELEGGQEILFVSKVFATLTAFLAIIALILHIVYFFIRRPLVRTSSIFMLGAAGLFGLFAIFVFVGFYNTVSGETAVGVAFILFIIGTIFCFVAAAFTAWASIKKATTAAGLIDME